MSATLFLQTLHSQMMEMFGGKVLPKHRLHIKQIGMAKIGVQRVKLFHHILILVFAHLQLSARSLLQNGKTLRVFQSLQSSLVVAEKQLFH
jgi:hypothetical protein